MIKIFNNDTEWEIFQNVIQQKKSVYAKSPKERILFEKIQTTDWRDNTSTRPDFISEELMIEMFEIDDIVTQKKGKNNPQRKADARAMRDVEKWISSFPENTFHKDLKIIANGDTRYNPETDSFTPDDSVSHHNYQAYIENFSRICQKHLDSVNAYRNNYPDKQLGFLIVDDSTFYFPKQNEIKMTSREAFRNLPFFDKNFMKMFIKSNVDFVIWAFNNKYFYTKDNPRGQNSFLPKVVMISKDSYYNKNSKYFKVDSMRSLEK